MTPRKPGSLFLPLLVAAVLGLAPAARGQVLTNYPTTGSDTGEENHFGAATQGLRLDLLSRGLRWRFGAIEALGRGGAPHPAAGITPVAEGGAGPLGDGWTLWHTSSFTWQKDRRAPVANRGEAASFTIGLDRELAAGLTGGISANYIHTSLDTFFNAGKSRTDGFSIGPYASLAFSDWLSLDASAAYVHNREKMRRALPGAATGRRHSDGYVLSAALSASKWFGGVLLSGKAGVIASRDAWDAYTESDGTPHAAETNRLVQGQAELSASWWLDPFLPHAGVMYAYDLSSNDPNRIDRDDFTFSGGLAWYGSGRWEGLSADLAAEVVVGRQRQRNATISLGLRWNF